MFRFKRTDQLIGHSPKLFAVLLRSLFYLVLMCYSYMASSQLNAERSRSSTDKRANVQSVPPVDGRLLSKRIEFFVSNLSANPHYADSIDAYAARALTAGIRTNSQEELEKMYWLLIDGLIDVRNQKAGPSDNGQSWQRITNLLARVNSLAHIRGTEKTAENFANVARSLERKDINLDPKVTCFSQSVTEFLAAGNKTRASETLYDLGFAYNLKGDLEKAQHHYIRSIEIGKEAKRKGLHQVYGVLGNTYTFQGEYKQALEYELQALRVAKAEGDTSVNFGVINLFLGLIYEAFKDYNEALAYYQQAYAVFRNYPATNMGDLGSSATNVAKLMMYKDPQASIAFLHELVQKFPSITTHGVYQSVQVRLMQAHQKTGDLAKANEHCASLLRIAEGLPPSGQLHLYIPVIQYLIISQQYQDARKYLPTLKSLAEKLKQKPLIKEAAYYQFKVDSAASDFPAALKNYMYFKRLNDTILDETKTKEIARLRIQYDTEKKDNDLKLQEQSIALLTKEAALQRSVALSKDQELALRAKNIDLLKAEQALQQLAVNNANREVQVRDQNLKIKEQNIALLTKEGFIKEASLRESRFLRNVVIGGATLLLIFLFLLYNRYKLRQNIIKQMGINNNMLKKMNTEKEWLLKEVHHRVKNNLQTVVSLLQSQSAYLQSDAFNAIQDSQNRIHAMSLVHQKLYRADNVASINMSTYLSDLVCHLFDSYDAKDITYEVDAEPIDLDVSQAIPVGLIVNEAVTNSLKYAFTGVHDRAKELFISFKRKEELLVLLTISDNGKGLSAGPGQEKPGGLGLSLMRGLAEDLEGQFWMGSKHGTSVSVLFQVSRPLHNHEEARVVQFQTS